MKRFAAFAVAATIALPALPVLAAENEVVVAVAIPVPTPTPPWPGFYTGVHLGFGMGTEYDTQSLMFEVVQEPGDTFPIRGPVGGFHVGFNIAADALVLGVETDLDWTRIRGSIEYAYLGIPNDPGLYGTLSFRTDLQTSARLRAGVAVGDGTLVYATGGVAFARGTMTDDAVWQGIPMGATSESQWFRGYTFGGGFEQLLGSGISARLEVRHSRFNVEDFAYAHEFEGETYEVRFNQTTATLGLTMHY